MQKMAAKYDHSECKLGRCQHLKKPGTVAHKPSADVLAVAMGLYSDELQQNEAKKQTQASTSSSSSATNVTSQQPQQSCGKSPINCATSDNITHFIQPERVTKAMKMEFVRRLKMAVETKLYHEQLEEEFEKKEKRLKVLETLNYLKNEGVRERLERQDAEIATITEERDGIRLKLETIAKMMQEKDATITQFVMAEFNRLKRDHSRACKNLIRAKNQRLIMEESEEYDPELHGP